MQCIHVTNTTLNLLFKHYQMSYDKLFIQLAAIAFWTLFALTAHAQPRKCQELPNCIQQSGCEDPTQFGNTEERRTSCIKRCAQSVDECKAKQKLDISQEEKMKSAGGKPTPICPRNFIFTGAPQDQDKFGNYKCFAKDNTPIPTRFQCPTGMEVYIPPGSQGMMMCRWTNSK